MKKRLKECAEAYTTGIRNLTPSPSPQGEGSDYYTLDGRRVVNPTKGIYIKNGKKTVIK